jgi:hypothetical protein
MEDMLMPSVLFVLFYFLIIVENVSGNYDMGLLLEFS